MIAKKKVDVNIAATINKLTTPNINIKASNSKANANIKTIRNTNQAINNIKNIFKYMAIANVNVILSKKQRLLNYIKKY